MCKHLNIRCYDNGDGIDTFTCVDCGANVQPQLNKHDLWGWVVEHQCEFCDEFFTHEPIPYPDSHSRYAKATFCCDECASEAHENVLVNARETAREYEMYGYDMDSWYR